MVEGEVEKDTEGMGEAASKTDKTRKMNGGRENQSLRTASTLPGINRLCSRPRLDLRWQRDTPRPREGSQSQL